MNDEYFADFGTCFECGGAGRAAAAISAEYALALGLVVSAVILMALMPVLKETMELLIDIASKSGVSQTLSIIVKSLGIAFVAGIAADICRDAGESAMAAKVELAGKVAILSMAMPMAAQLMELFERILQ